MPSTRRSQTSGNDQAQGQTESSGSLSPKITRSGRVLPPQDGVELESTARGAKRRKTASPPPLKEIVEQDISPAIPEDRTPEESHVQVANGDKEASFERRDAEESNQEEDGKDNEPAVTTAPRPDSGTFLEVSSTSEIVDIPTLANLADQILDVNIRLTPKELGSFINDPTSTTGKDYMQLQAQFGAAKQRYGGAKPFLSPPDLGSTDPGHIEICRRVNITTFVSSLFDGRVGLEDLDNHFLFLFVPRGGTLSKLAASLWIELKTQAFIASVVTSDPRPPAKVLSILFTESVRERLLEIRPGSEELAQSEEDFLDRMRSRRKILEAEIAKDTSNLLPQRHRWEDFLGEATSYIKILKLDGGALTGSERLLLKSRQSAAQGKMETSSSQNGVSNGSSSSHVAKPPGYLDTPEESFEHKLARCALLAIQSQGVPYFTHDDLPYPLIAFSTQLQEPRPRLSENVLAKAANDTTKKASVPHSSQTAPTLVLYERARTAAEKEGLHPPQTATHEASNGDRRPWTIEEEEALMEGLDRVQGRHWIDILSDEKLKERTELQLKDKARSLKLFFLKAGVEVPYYLKEVTGVPLKKEEEKPSVTDAAVKAENTA